MEKLSTFGIVVLLLVALILIIWAISCVKSVMSGRYKVLSDGKFKVGDKVRYIPEYRNTDEAENGIVKGIPEHTTESVRVVFHCGGDWENYQNYTAAMTNLRDLKKGWR